MTAAPPTNKRLYRPRRKLWTREQYERAVAMGIFTSDERLELIEGEIVHKTSHTQLHTTGISLVLMTLNHIFADGSDVRSQLPLALGNRNEPEPDIAVVTGSPRDYAAAHPTTAVLVIEVSDTTLRLDRTTKAGLYARAGIAEYWIINLSERVVEVHREPAAMRGYPLGHSYQSVTRYAETDILSPLAAPDTQVAVADLLP